MTSGQACSLFCHNHQFDSCSNLAVQLQAGVVFASLANGAVRQAHVAFVQVSAGSSNCISNILSTDRTKQLALFTRVGSDAYFNQSSQLVGTSLGCCTFLGSNALQFGTASFKLGDVFRSSCGCLALRQQVVAGK